VRHASTPCGPYGYRAPAHAKALPHFEFSTCCPANGDYRLSLSSPYKNRATDGGDPGVDFDALFAKTARALNGISKTLGDYNGDGTVDAADYVVWRKDLNRIQAQYDLWRAHFGQMSGSGTMAIAAVSEPSTLVMLVLATAGVCSRRRRAA
jgi:PEP-CTERM motif